MRVVTDEGAMRAAMLPTLTAKSLQLANVGKVGCQARSRVDTGAMRASFEAHPIGVGGATWGSSNDHVIYNEYGTYKMSAQPMVRPSVGDVAAAL